ncbi:DUF3086 domain-containing protein [Vasconcelosia minhoensis]|nr:DUF3086 domain-containing protein [Romeria gracilis]
MTPDEFSDAATNDNRPETAEPTRVSQADADQISTLRAQKAELEERVETLQTTNSRLTQGSPPQPPQPGLERLIQTSLRDLESQRRELQRQVEQLERRKERIEAEMRTSFAGASQDIAIRVQGFKEYLIGSLQDLARAAEQLELAPPAAADSPAEVAEPPAAETDPPTVGFAAQRFEQQRDRVRSLLDQYRTRPDYYGPSWQLRRTFEPIHADRVANWFFTQGGRGAVKSLGSRLQNVLVASAAVSALHTLYGDRLCALVLASTPERLGEWRRWLQDCLGISRADFGTNRGVMLFEAPEPMVQRAERLLDSGRLPILLIDESEEKISLSLLQFPLWLAFAPDPANPIADYEY